MGDSVKKSKLVSLICLGLLCVSMLVVGVFAAVQASYNLSADVNFNPKGVFVEMSGQIYRGSNHEALEPVYDDTTYTLKTCKNYVVMDESSAANEPFKNINVSAWNFNSVKFFPQHRWIQVRLSIKNMGKENISVIPTTDLSITNVTIYEEAAETLLIEPGETKEYKLNLKLNDGVTSSISNTTFSMPLDIRKTSDIENQASDFTMNSTTTTQLDSISSNHSNLVYGKRVVVVPNSLGAKTTKTGTSSSYAFQNLGTSTKYVIFPQTLNQIGNYTFNDCTTDLGSVSIPNSVTSIGNSAFSGCTSLTSIAIPSSVTSIGSGAFYGCSSLTSIAIPSSVTSIGDSVFNSCISLMITVDSANPNYSSLGGSWYNKNKTTLIRGAGKAVVDDIPSSVTSIGNSAFSGCTSLTSIAIPNSVTSIGYNAFEYCTSLTSITIPSGVASIKSNTFKNCTSLASIMIPSSVTGIGTQAFYNCTSLTSVSLPNSVTGIETQAFYNCTSLTSVTLPTGLTSLYQNVFYNCTSLTEITIPANVTQMGHTVFSGCTKLTTVNMLGDAPKIYSDTFGYPSNVPYRNSGFTIWVYMSKAGNYGNTGGSGASTSTCSDANWYYYNAVLDIIFD